MIFFKAALYRAKALSVLAVLLFCVAAMVSCRKNDVQGYLNVSPSGKQYVDATATRIKFYVESNLRWSVGILGEGFGADRVDGRGNDAVEVTFGENRSAELRRGTVTFTAVDDSAPSGLHKTVVEIEQHASIGPVASYLDVELLHNDLEADELSALLSIDTDGRWSIETRHLSPDFSTPWQIVPSEEYGSGYSEVKLETDINYEYDRSAEIIVSAGDLTQTIILRQAGLLGTTAFPAWTELPAIELDRNSLFYSHFTNLAGGAPVRNYSLLYDRQTYMSYWVAYPLHNSYMGTGRTDKWGYDPKIPRAWQVDYSSAWGANYYDRGHQIPSADRNATGERGNLFDMNVQTFHYTNITPQRWQLNQRKWESLEGFLREKVADNADTIWVVTGASLRSHGGAEPVTYLPKKNGAGDEIDVPVPNYFFKVALWHRTVGESKQYSAIGFWVENADATGSIVRTDAITVRDVEELTGFDFFTNIPATEQDVFETTVGEGWFTDGNS